MRNNGFYTLLERAFPLPPKKDRCIPFLKSRNAIPELPVHFLVHKLMRILLYIGFILSIIVMADAWSKSGWIVDPAEFAIKPWVMSCSFSKIMVPIALAMTLLLYFRIKLFFDLKKEVLLLVVGDYELAEQPQEKWLHVLTWRFLIFLVAVFFAYLVPYAIYKFITPHPLGLIVGQLFTAGGIAAFTPSLAALALMYEKTDRYFEAAQNDLKFIVGKTKQTTL